MKRPHTLLELLKMFGRYLTLSRGCSEATLNTYEAAWSQLFRYASAHRNLRPTQVAVEDLTPQFVTDFLLHLETRGNKVSTRNNRLAGIQAFFQFIAELDPLRYAAQAEHMETIRSKRGGGPPPMDYLTREEARAVIEAPNVETWAGLRNRAMLTLMFQTGIRSSEARALRLEDYYVLPSPGIHIRNGKGRKHRDLPLHANTVIEIDKWLRARGPEEGPLFPTNRMTHMTSDALELIVRTFIKKAIKACASLANRNITPHILRHTAAMFMLESKVDLAVISLYLGHADVGTTYRYLHHNRRIKEEAVQQTSYPEPKRKLVENNDNSAQSKTEETPISRTKYLKD